MVREEKSREGRAREGMVENLEERRYRGVQTAMAKFLLRRRER